MKRTTTLFILLSLFGSFFMSAQTANVTGTVKDQQKQPLVYANVILYDSETKKPIFAVTTNEEGIYMFKEIDFGNYYLDATLLGFKTKSSEPFKLTSSETRSFDFILEEDQPKQLDEVVLEYKKPTIKQTAEKLVVDLENSQMVNSNVRDVIKKIPGMLVTNNNLSYAGQGNIRILINGKNTNYMDMTTLLREMPADNIAKVELIQQPGAEYDADGSGPIINIILKKNVKLGTYGTIKGMIGYVDDVTYRTSASIASFKGKVNWQASASYSKSSWREDLQIVRRVGEDTYDQFSRSPYDPNTFRIGAGIDYYMNDKHSTGINFRTINSDSDRVTSNTTKITSDGTTETLVTDNMFDKQWNLFVVSPYYEYDDDVNKFVFDFNYVHYESDNVNNLFQVGTSTIDYDSQRYFQDAAFDIYTYKADYKRVLNDKFTLRAGLKLSSVDSDNDLQSFTQDDSGTFVDNPLQTNRFLIDEDIFAAYTKINYEYKKWSFSAGLRWEESKTEGTSANLNTSLNRTISKFFPSFSVTRKITDEINANLAYSYRIQRPSYETLNPFVYYYDPFTFEEGNPTLQPALTNSARFNLTYDNQPFFSVSYRNTSDVLFQIVSQNDATAETSRSTINLANNENWSFSLFGPLNFIKNLEGFTGVIVNHAKYTSENLTPTLNNSRWSMTWYTNAEYKLPWDIQSEISGYYTSGGLDGQIDFKWIAGIDVAVSKKFMNDKLKVSLEWEEILDRKFYGSINYDNINANIVSDWARRNVFLQVSYSFGEKYNKKKKRSSASGDEVKRINTKQ